MLEAEAGSAGGVDLDHAGDAERIGIGAGGALRRGAAAGAGAAAASGVFGRAGAGAGDAPPRVHSGRPGRWRRVGLPAGGAADARGRHGRRTRELRLFAEKAANHATTERLRARDAIAAETQSDPKR